MSKLSMSTLTQSATWKALEKHFEEISQSHMRDMFTEDPQRFDKFSLKLNDILFDFSKNIITSETLENLYRHVFKRVRANVYAPGNLLQLHKHLLMAKDTF